jgi:hypothetical protein
MKALFISENKDAAESWTGEKDKHPGNARKEKQESDNDFQVVA